MASPVRRAGQWVHPQIVVEVGFSEWTNEGLLRHPRFLGLRDDKPATEVVRET
jgi:bifunctional non-homologous end joining protein LigD